MKKISNQLFSIPVKNIRNINNKKIEKISAPFIVIPRRSEIRENNSVKTKHFMQKSDFKKSLFSKKRKYVRIFRKEKDLNHQKKPVNIKKDGMFNIKLQSKSPPRPIALIVKSYSKKNIVFIDKNGIYESYADKNGQIIKTKIKRDLEGLPTKKGLYCLECKSYLSNNSIEHILIDKKISKGLWNQIYKDMAKFTRK